MVVSTSETTNIGDVADAKSEIDSDQDEASALPAYVIHTRHRLRVIKTVWTVHLSGKQKV